MAKQFQKAVIFGTFDIIHPGHISLFKYAQKLAKQIFVIIARDKNIERELLFNEKQRLENLKQYKIINNIILGSLDNPLDFYNEIKPDLIILGYDQVKNVNLLKKLSPQNGIPSAGKNITVKRAHPYHPEFFKSEKNKNIFKDKNAGFYLINKEKNCPSFKNVSILRKVLNLKKVGFSGTLDPMASGLMILASGKATKFLDAFHLLNKIYEAKIELGKISDTFDIEGNVETKNLSAETLVKAEQIKKILQKKFTGEIMQIPPIFSAKKINGKKLYELARKNEKIDIKPVKIKINKIKILKYKYPFLTLKINCSKGTYIRSIANDLGKELKTGGMLIELKRTYIGPFDLKHALEQNEIDFENLEKYKLSILDIIKQINQHILLKK